jgi:hypothetical protein
LVEDVAFRLPQVVGKPLALRHPGASVAEQVVPDEHAVAVVQRFGPEIDQHLPGLRVFHQERIDHKWQLVWERGQDFSGWMTEAERREWERRA